LKQIVLADDDQAALDGLRSLLVAWGFTVHTAQDGRAALALINEVRPAAVITDVVMPAMSGLELLEAVRRDEPALPVIVLTAHGTAETRRRAVAHGAFAYVPKPVDTGRLKSLLARAVEGAGGEAQS
jgi:two-component system, NtrC family, response regulator GlrR